MTLPPRRAVRPADEYRQHVETYFATATASAELFDPATETWSATASLQTARMNHSSAQLHDGRIVVAGGMPHGAGYFGSGFDSAEIYDPATGSWAYTAILFTDSDDWPVVDVGAAYRSQSSVENDFRQMKGPRVVSFSPMFHWSTKKSASTDQQQHPTSAS